MEVVHKHTEYSRITPRIYIGTNFCCTQHFNKELLKMGITADISLEEIRIDTPFGVKSYVWLPVKDHHPPTQYQFDIGVSAIGNAVRDKKKVYVHCKNGHGRAPTLVAAYLISRGMEVREAVKHVKSKRGGVHLTETQIKSLATFRKRTLKKRK